MILPPGFPLISNFESGKDSDSGPPINLHLSCQRNNVAFRLVFPTQYLPPVSGPASCDDWIASIRNEK